MPNHDDIERRIRELAELSKLEAKAAEEMQKRALAAKTPEEMAEYAAAFERLVRSVHRTIKLEARLVRSLPRERRQSAAPPEPGPPPGSTLH